MDFSQLAEAQLSTGGEWGPNISTDLHMFRNAPALHNLYLGDILLDCVPCPRNGIREFTSHSCPASECLDALQAFPNLTSAHLRPFLVDDDDDDELPIVRHVQLRHLTVDENGSDPDAWEDDLESRPIHILKYLALPALETMQISAMRVFEGAVIRAFLERSSPPLVKLTFKGYYLEIDSMVVLSSFKHLQDLEFRYCSTKLVSQFGALLEQDKECLPKLKNFAVMADEWPRSERLPAVPPWAHQLGPALAHWNHSRLLSVRIVLQGQLIDVEPEKMASVVRPFVFLKETGIKVYFGTKDTSIL
uniref:F-box domain-containing protein n=1 Tax=Mycena chlorophos TaxID=658473 RepID=A0ABQ0L947_MYCCL|nr:predicted protein [Mycena chlorophos]